MDEQIVDGVPTENTPEELPKEETPKEEPEASPLEAKNRQLYERATKAEKAEKVAKAEAERLKKVVSSQGIDVSEYINISASLEGLDSKEKERLAKEHKLTGRPLDEIRKDEDFILWQSAYREKVNKEKALSPNTNQPEISKPKTLEQELLEAPNQEEKGKILDRYGINPVNARNF